ncbi:MAG TPA: hypothetical protein VNA67_00305 [Pseudonocardiaceae bacterium]|nr:hypothetical protein [Pseudonocardiaceae bacterium]
MTVVERDILPHDLADRRGVPQGRHLQALHARGRELLDELFPGFTEQLVRAGAVTAAPWATPESTCRVSCCAKPTSACPR